MNTRVHEKLKYFLIELGESKGYKSYSGDSQPLDIRLKQKHIEYQPDVVWKTKRGKRFVFEIAFTEDWRAVAGEFVLSSLAECSKFLVFRYVNDKDKIDSEIEKLYDLLSILGEHFKETTWYYWILTKDNIKNFEKLKKDIKRELKKWGFIR